MTISSRTPEGEPASCPLCYANVRVEPSVLIGDATCPQCGHLLWFIQTGDLLRCFDADRTSEVKRRIVEIIAERHQVDHEQVANNPNLLNVISVDSLDIVELVMELEGGIEER